jgi:hypothetical protein
LPRILVSSKSTLTEYHHSLSSKDTNVELLNQVPFAEPEIQIPHLALDEILNVQIAKILDYIRAVHGLDATIRSISAPENLHTWLKTSSLDAVDLVPGTLSHHREIYSPFEVLATEYDRGCMPKDTSDIDDARGREVHEHRDPKYVVVLDYQIRNLQIMIGTVAAREATLLGRISMFLKEVCCPLTPLSPFAPSPLSPPYLPSQIHIKPFNVNP